MADANGSDTDPIVFMDIAIGGEPLGRIKFQLNTTTTPLTSRNFHALCTGTHRSPAPPFPPLGYKGSRIHFIKRAHYIQGGDISPSHDGSGPPTSIYNLQSGSAQRGFPDENYTLRFEGEGWLGMVNEGGKGNGCQFLVTTGGAGAGRGLEGRSVCFGRVVEGMEVVRAIEQTRLRAGGVGGEGRPVGDVVIVECGEM